MTFDQFLEFVDKVYYENEFEVRYGQTIMNVLHKVWPEKYAEISKSDLDCFYDDGTIKLTLEKLEKDWVNLDNRV